MFSNKCLQLTQVKFSGYENEIIFNKEFSYVKKNNAQIRASIMYIQNISSKYK